jgi:AcrR family transcriptional regulator
VTALPGGGSPAVAGDAVPGPEGDLVRLAPTRERLLRAGREVVEEQGYAGASVAAIAARAGVANGTLYRHFGAKAELFVEVFRDVCGREVEAMRAAVEAASEAGADPVDRVLAPLEVFAGRALQNRALAWALLAEPVDPLVDAVRLEYRRTYRELLAGVLAEAVAAGDLPPQDPGLTAAALVGAVGEALVGPLSAGGARGSAGDPAGRGTRGHGQRPAGSAEAGGADDARLLDELRTFCRRATGAACRVGADARREPR